MAATFQRKQFPLRYAHSSRDKFFWLPGAPLRCARKRCSQPVPRRSDHNRTRWARTLFNRKEIHHGKKRTSKRRQRRLQRWEKRSVGKESVRQCSNRGLHNNENKK